ncbi:15744_t:CDS:2, partial [Funneliformis caledonium]
ICGLKKLKLAINDYLQNIEKWLLQKIENEIICIELFEIAYLDNDYGIIICITSDYYGQNAYSKVCVKIYELEHDNHYLTDNGLCYAKVLLILQLNSKKLDQQNIDFAFIYWYNFAYPNYIQKQYFYKCAIIKHVEYYTLILIALI